MNKSEMTASERFGNLVRGKSIDRLPVIEWAQWWNLTRDRWHREGLPKNLMLQGEIQSYFGLDRCIESAFSAVSADTPKVPSYGLGIIHNEADYERILPTLYHDISFSKEEIATLKKNREKGDAIQYLTLYGFFWFPRDLFGIEDHLYSFYDNPDLYKRICDDYLRWFKRVFEIVGNTFRFDYMDFAEDMSYNNGPMISKEIFDEFLAPYYREIISIIKKQDIPVFIDSDGDITMAVDWYASVGANGMFPLERQAGADVAEYIKKQPQMTFMGHFNKMCMKHGEEAMRQEFERLLPSCKAGKFIPAVDHQTPPDVSIDNYKTYVRLLKEYAAKVQK